MRRWSFGVIGVAILTFAAAVLTFYRAPLWVSDQVIRFHLRQQHVRSEYVRVDGYRMHFLEARPHHVAGMTETPLVLVHGLGARGEDWSGMIPTLAAQGFHVYALDLLGYGRSAKPDVEYSIALEEKMTADFMQAVGLPRADLGGWSMGGWVVARLAVDHPARVNRLVLYDAAGIYFPATFDASLFTPSDPAGLWRLQRMLSPAPRPLPNFVARSAVEKLQQNAWVIERSVVSMEGGRDLLDFRLHELTQPTLIVWGSRDVLIPPPVGEAMHHAIAGSSLLVVEGCGHLAPVECVLPVLQGTVNFLKAEPPIRGSETVVAGR